MGPRAPSFYLTNGSDKPPIVHTDFVPSTRTWQYVVADPSTHHCIIIDPVRDRCEDKAAISTAAADTLVGIVKKHGYLVDYLIETQSSAAQHQSASWYLRMQFSDLQGWPPQLFSEGTVSAMESLWRRKYGADSNLLTKHGAVLGDGESMMVGRMRVRCMHVPGFGTPNRRAFVVGNSVFGAHSLATLSRESQCATLPENPSAATSLDPDECFRVCASMQRLLSLPEETNAYFDLEDKSDPAVDPSDEIRQCRILNEYVGLSAKEFFVRWEGENRARLQWRQQMQATKPSRRKKR